MSAGTEMLVGGLSVGANYFSVHNIPLRQGRELARFSGRIEVYQQTSPRDLWQPALLGGAVDQDAFRRETFGQRSTEFELTDDFNGPPGPPPPLQERPQRLRLAREPMANGQMAKVLVQLASQDDPPLRWAAGADAIGTFEKKAQDLLAQANAYLELSASLAHDVRMRASESSPLGPSEPLWMSVA